MTLVHTVPQCSAADFSVHVVESRGVADLLVYRENVRELANWNEGVWCFLPSRMGGAKAVHFTDEPALADLHVCFVESRSMSGWMKHHPLKGKIALKR